MLHAVHGVIVGLGALIVGYLLLPRRRFAAQERVDEPPFWSHIGEREPEIILVGHHGQ